MSQMGSFGAGGGGGGAATTFNADFGTAMPVAGIINLLGGNNIVTNAAGNTVTFNVTDDVTLAGFLSAAGNITSTAGAVDAATTVTAGMGVIATTGDIYAIQGDLVADAGDLVLLDGNIVLGVSDGLDGQIPIAITGVGNVAWANITAGANIAIANGPNTITISANSGAFVVKYTAVNFAASPYVVLATDYYLGVDVSAGPVSILLPNAPTAGRIFVVKDKAGLSQVDNITVTTVAGIVLIDGAVTLVMNNAYQSVQFIFNGVSYEAY